jgi:hypothetical protein
VRLLKRTLFWIEIVVTFLALGLGVFLTIRLLSGSAGILESVVAIARFAWYLLVTGIGLLPKVPSVAASALFWYSLYIWSLFYFSQTKREKKLLNLIIPISLGAVIFCSIGIFGAVLSGLASQGAGQ